MLRALTTEVMKWRRTWFLLVTAGAVLAGPVLNLIIYASRDDVSTWSSVMNNGLMFHLVLTGPLVVTLIGGQLIAAEYQWETWKLSLTAPVPRWSIYLAKWIVGVVWVLALSLLAGAGALLDGLLVHAAGPSEAGLWMRAFLLGGVGLSAMLSLYHLITLVTRNFFVTSGVGIVATFAGLIAMQSKYIGLYPISANLALMYTLLRRPVSDLTLGSPAIWITVLFGAALIGLLGSLLFVQKADYR